jgi:hypothetical protein
VWCLGSAQCCALLPVDTYDTWVDRFVWNQECLLCKSGRNEREPRTTNIHPQRRYFSLPEKEATATELSAAREELDHTGGAGRAPFTELPAVRNDDEVHRRGELFLSVVDVSTKSVVNPLRDMGETIEHNLKQAEDPSATVMLESIATTLQY